MRVCHNISAVFDDPNLIGAAGLVPVMALAGKAGLPELVSEHVSVPGSAGANADLKVGSLVAGMVVGADSIKDMDVVRHGGMGRVFTGHRAPTTLGTHLRGYTFGHVRQLDAVGSRVLVNLTGIVPGLLAGADQVAHLDVDEHVNCFAVINCHRILRPITHRIELLRQISASMLRMSSAHNQLQHLS